MQSVRYQLVLCGSYEVANTIAERKRKPQLKKCLEEHLKRKVSHCGLRDLLAMGSLNWYHRFCHR
jgi:hypothetical protein